jgi:hypothetical protein
LKHVRNVLLRVVAVPVLGLVLEGLNKNVLVPRVAVYFAKPPQGFELAVTGG